MDHQAAPLKAERAYQDEDLDEACNVVVVAHINPHEVAVVVAAVEMIFDRDTHAIVLAEVVNGHTSGDCSQH